MDQNSIVELLTLPRDLKLAAATLGRDEARYLVDSYYQIQDFRKATGNQDRALDKLGEPHGTVAFFASQFHTLEKQIGGALDVYSANDDLGAWARAHVGVGPVIAAGLLAHIDISRAATTGQIWRFAGLDDPANYEWGKGQKRPWNARLKVLCWKLGDSFVKFSGREDCFYGNKLYRARKEFELKRDAEGYNAPAAAKTLETRNIKDKETIKIYQSGRLPAGRLDLRARRYAVKLFLASYHKAGYRLLHGEDPPKPWAIEFGGHSHEIWSPVPFPPLRKAA